MCRYILFRSCHFWRNNKIGQSVNCKPLSGGILFCPLHTAKSTFSLLMAALCTFHGVYSAQIFLLNLSCYHLTSLSPHCTHGTAMSFGLCGAYAFSHAPQGCLPSLVVLLVEHEASPRVPACIPMVASYRSRCWEAELKGGLQLKTSEYQGVSRHAGYANPRRVVSEP